ncbi:MAG: tetrahydrofolate dehydrogenase/cyclohydrolase catalytic domain-containing protein, partial [Clostridia bacterium]
MEAIRLDGKKLASEIELQLLKRVNVLKQKYNYTPVLAAIIVGEDPASKTYV